eukprot:scaffold3640_cov201-Alexandrium_tamarense.AAC.2
MTTPHSESSLNDTIRASLLAAEEYHLDSDLNDNNKPSSSLTSSMVARKFTTVINNIAQFKKGEADTIRRVLDEIDVISLKRTSEGFSEFNFSIGVLNCFFIVFMFGAHPEHLWLVYLMEGMFMIPKKFFNMWRARPLNQALYYLDFCWAMNFIAIFVILLLMMSGLKGSLGEGEGELVSSVARESFFNALLGVSCGPLMGANIVLPFVACLFHDVNTMTGLFIHIMPPMVMYTLLWHWEDIKESWPSIFHLSYMDGLHYFPKDGAFFVPGSGE